MIDAVLLEEFGTLDVDPSLREDIKIVSISPLEKAGKAVFDNVELTLAKTNSDHFVVARKKYI